MEVPNTVANKTERTIVCFAPNMVTTDGIWQGDNPFDFSLTLFIMQLTIVVLTTRFLVFLLKPLHQPRVVPEILAGIVLGPSLMGRNVAFANLMFPVSSVMVLETMANIGLVYFLFLVGVEMDLSVVRQAGRKAICIAIAGMICPFIICALFTTMLHHQIAKGESPGTYMLFLGVALSVTAFPVLARLLAELKLMNTEIGKLAMSSALINDMCAWILLALAISLTHSEHKVNTIASIWVILCSAVFVILCIYVVRPGITWMIQRTPEGESFNEFYLCLILTGVMISGFITDTIGTHSVFGAFVFGLAIPNGSLGLTLIEKLEDFVSGLLLPLFFATSGLKTNVGTITGGETWGIIILIIILSCIGKIAGTLVVASFCKLSLMDGFTLGLLMNTKGLIEMVILNVGRDQKVLDDESFAVMVVIAVIMTAIISPTVSVVYKASRRSVAYRNRAIQILKADVELRSLVCIHNARNAPPIIKLLEVSNPTKKSPIFVYVLHLVELTGRESAMLIAHNTHKSAGQAANGTQAQSDPIIHAFENLEQQVGSVFVHPLTAISPYSTMHEDICTLAGDKHIALIIIPFHKQQTVDGGMETLNPAYRMVNQNVLANAPCSVGILVDRGLVGATRMAGNEVMHHIAVLFLGGPDDREALAYGWRMSEHSATCLTLLRFVHGNDASESDTQSTRDGNDSDKEKRLDDEYINEFRTKTADDVSITYAEEVVSNGEETIAAIKALDSSQDLFLVGRGQGTTSLTSGLTDWSECPELGAIGDILASADFAATASVLVIQQYAGGVPVESRSSDSSGHSEDSG